MGDVRLGLIGQGFESAVDVAVCDGDRLLGLVTIEKLLAAPAHAPLDEIMDHSPPVVAPGVDQKQAAWRAAVRGESSLAIVDVTRLTTDERACPPNMPRCVTKCPARERRRSADKQRRPGRRLARVEVSDCARDHRWLEGRDVRPILALPRALRNDKDAPPTRQCALVRALWPW